MRPPSLERQRGRHYRQKQLDEKEERDRLQQQQRDRENAASQAIIAAGIQRIADHAAAQGEAAEGRDKANRRWEWKLLSVQIASVVVAVIGAGVVLGQFNAMLRANKATRDSIVEANRAWIAPDGIEAADDARNKTGSVKLGFVNTGRAPALHFQVRAAYYLARWAPTDTNRETVPLEDRKSCASLVPAVREDRTIFPGAPHGVIAELPAFSAADQSALEAGTRALFIYGCAAYGSFDVPRHTPFCYEFVPPSAVAERWHFAECSEYGEAD